MPSRAQVIELLDQGHTYETAARELGIAAGLAAMIATGQPADESLIGPPAFNPTRNPRVIEWVKGRASRELTQ